MKDLQLSTDIITDSNCWHRRFFRCYIDGSYHGEGHYKSNCETVRDNYDNDRALRSLAINQWCSFMSGEFTCSPSTVQRHMVNTFTGNQLDAINAELIDDLRDLVREDMECES